MPDLNLRLFLQAIDKGVAKVVGSASAGVDKLKRATGEGTKATRASTDAEKALTDALAGRGKLTAEQVRALGGWNAVNERAAAILKEEAEAARKAASAVEELGKKEEKASERAGDANRRRQRERHGGGGGFFGFGTLADAAKFTLAYGAVSKAMEAAGAVLASPVEFFKWSLTQSESLVQMREHARAVRMTTDEYQALEYAFKRNNLDASKLDETLDTLSKNQITAARRKGDQRIAFRVLGVNPIEGGKIKPLAELLNQVADAYAKIADRQRRAYVAGLLFGTQAKDLDPILAGGSKGLRDNAAAARDAGYLLTGQTIDQAEELNRSWNDLKLTLLGFSRTALSEALPAIKEIVAGWDRWMVANRGLVRSDLHQFFSNIEAAAPKIEEAAEAGFKILVNTDWAKVGRGVMLVVNTISDVADAVDKVGRAWNAIPEPLRKILGGISNNPVTNPLAGAGKALDLLTATPAEQRSAADAALAGWAALGAPGAAGTRRDPVTGKITVYIEDNRTYAKAGDTSEGWVLDVSRGMALNGGLP